MRRAVLVLMFLVSCGGDEGWSDQARTDFIAGCTDAGSPQDVCECLQEKLEEANPELDDPADIDTEQGADFTRECLDE